MRIYFNIYFEESLTRFSTKHLRNKMFETCENVYVTKIFMNYLFHKNQGNSGSIPVVFDGI